MTVKAGQKCTAIRRVIAPRAFTDALVAALGDRLAKTALGDPANEATRMGPLASLDQRKEVRERIRELQQEAEIVAGNPDDGARRLRRRRGRRLPEPGRALRRQPAGEVRHPRRRGLRAGVHRHALRRPRRGHRARPPRQGLARRLGLHRRQGGGGGGRPRPRPVPRPRADRQPAERQDLHRPRLAAAGPRPRRPRPGRRRRGDGRHPRREALHAAHRRPGRAAAALGGHRPLDRGRGRVERRRPTRSASPWPSSGSATSSSPRRAR